MENLNNHKRGTDAVLIGHYNVLWRSVMAMLALFLCLSSNAVAQETDPNCIEDNTGELTNVTLNGVPYTGDISSILSGVTQGSTVRICFTAPAGASTYTLVSYKAPSATFSPETAVDQVLFDYETVNTNGGESVCLEVDVPNCFFQIDFVRGCKIDQLGPPGSGNYYGDLYGEGRLIAYETGGSGLCLEGCTPGYWKQEQHFGNWGCGYIAEGPNATLFFGDVFSGVNNYQGLDEDLTLLEALNLGGGDFNALARHAAAAILNSCADVNYKYDETEIRDMVTAAFNTNKAKLAHSKLESANEEGCPLDRAELTATATSALQSLEATGAGELRAYPTPFSDRATISFTTAVDENYSVRLYDMKGSLITELKTGRSTAGVANEVEVDGTNLQEGLYLARMLSDSGMKTVKLLLKKQ
jgi:hypothetical protein